MNYADNLEDKENQPFIKELCKGKRIIIAYIHTKEEQENGIKRIFNLNNNNEDNACFVLD